MITKPVYVGQAVLDLSKILMYTFMYKYMIPKYGSERVNLLMTDTDSFLFEIHDTKTDLYMDMKDALHWFDTSSYPVDHFLHSEKNKTVLGTFHNETHGKPIEEFYGLRSKMYTFKVYGEKKEKKKAKGISMCAKEHHFTFSMYEEALRKKLKQWRQWT